MNVIPGDKSYLPFSSFAVYSSNGLDARAQGAAFFRATDATARNFAGDATKLYRLVALAWDDASRLVGGVYATGSDEGWQFTKFGVRVIAVNGTDVMQVFNIDSATDFSALGGSSPTGPRFVTVVRDFVVVGRTAADRQLVQWSAIDNATDWVTSASTMADSQTLPDGDWIQGIIGGEYGIIFQERAIRRMTFIGSPVIFQFDKISNELGVTISGSIAAFGDRAFFCDRSGFYMLISGAQIVPIGERRVNTYFWDDLDQSYFPRVTAAVDPVNHVYAISYPGSGHSAGTPNKMLVYNWVTDRWSHAEPGALDMIYSGASQTGYTLAGLDAVSATLGGLPFPLGSPVWAGIGRPLFAAFNTAFRLGYFNATPLAATVDTTEAQLFPGRRAYVRAVRPLVDGGVPTVAIGSRNLQTAAVSFGSDVAANGNGVCRMRSNARYHRARIKVPASAAWDHIVGVDDVDASPGWGR